VTRSQARRLPEAGRGLASRFRPHSH
jgi:hypothetical protein